MCRLRYISHCAVDDTELSLRGEGGGATHQLLMADTVIKSDIEIDDPSVICSFHYLGGPLILKVWVLIVDISQAKRFIIM